MDNDQYKVVRIRYKRVNPVTLYGLFQIEGGKVNVDSGKPHNAALHWYNKNTPEAWEPLPRGGQTLVTVKDNVTGKMATGVATCSMSDQFCYKTGREMAYNKALKKLK